MEIYIKSELLISLVYRLAVVITVRQIASKKVVTNIIMNVDYIIVRFLLLYQVFFNAYFFI